MRLIALLIFSLAGLLSWPADAQDIPGRVGRIAYIEGSAAVYYDPDEGWERAYVNAPVTTENSLWTEPGSRAEMRVGSMAIRLDEATQLDVSQLDDEKLEAFVAQGSVAIRERHYRQGDLTVIFTPHARFRLFGSGRYRIDVDTGRDETLLTVFAGSVSMRAGTGDIRIEPGRAVRIYGGSRPSFVNERVENTAFDRWTLARDEQWVERSSVRYVSTDMTGYEELDAYGEWVEEPDFGAVWFPQRVARDWVPYRDGHWEYVRPWGWTWIGYEPWGYAPYHYGRWVYVRDRWGWYPGPKRVERPVWAPALVAWVGGSNFSVSVGGSAAPAMGWYPLSPWDRYDPWYRAPATYVNRVNIIVRDSPRDDRRRQWREWTRERGATIVHREQFGRERSVRQAALPVTPQMLGQVRAVNPTQVLPSREQVQRRRSDTPRRGGAAAVSPQVQGAPPAQPAPQVQGSPQARRERAPAPRPDFKRREASTAPAQATQPPVRAAPQGGQPVIQGAPPAATPRVAPAPAPSGNPMARGNDRERAEREQQQAQERAQREQQQAQERTQREQQKTQERTQREQQKTQERTQREQQQAQERAQREAQQQQQQQQQQQRAQREAQQQQRQQEQQQKAQERVQRETPKGQERVRAAPPPKAAPEPKAAPQAEPQPQGNPMSRGARPQPAPPAERGKGADKDDDNDRKGGGKGRERER